jgi:hypothetical protein
MAARKKGRLEDLIDRYLMGNLRGAGNAALRGVAEGADLVYSPERINPAFKGQTFRDILEAGIASNEARAQAELGDRMDIVGMLGEQAAVAPLYLVNPLTALAGKTKYFAPNSLPARSFAKRLSKRLPNIADDVLAGAATGVLMDSSSAAEEAIFGGGLSALGNMYGVTPRRRRAAARFAAAGFPAVALGADAVAREKKEK